MKRRLPVVYSKMKREKGELFEWQKTERQLFEIILDSPAWFEWLEQEKSFRLTSWQASGQAINIR